MNQVDMSRLLDRIFTHGGIVRDVNIEWKEPKTCLIKVDFMPWSRTLPEDVTDHLLDAGTIINREYLYFRVANDDQVVTATMTIDLTQEDWRKSLAKQMSYIIAHELRISVSENE